MRRGSLRLAATALALVLPGLAARTPADPYLVSLALSPAGGSKIAVDVTVGLERRGRVTVEAHPLVLLRVTQVVWDGAHCALR